MNTSSSRDQYFKGIEKLVDVVQDLSLARDIKRVTEIVRKAAREISGADGATFVMREGDMVFYLDEDAIEPLWKGQRFPMSACVSGWSIQHCEQILIEDIYQDQRVPHDAYRPTFVKSMTMTPVRRREPIAAIGTYWAKPYTASREELNLLQSLADSISIALENIQLYSEMHKALEQATNASRALARQLELRDEFISVAAHELQTPLTPLILQTQIMETNLLKPKDRPVGFSLEKSFVIMHRQVDEMVARVESMVDVTKIRLNRFEIFPEPNVSLLTLVNKAISCLPRKEVPILVDIDSNIKGTWDPLRITQLVKNLLSNAIRFGQAQPIEVRANAKRDENRVFLTIKDSGLGIAPSEHERIFERFERGVSYQNFGGMGLGLFIARKIAETHGGKIQVQSDLGAGATFTLELPLVAPSVAH